MRNWFRNIGPGVLVSAAFIGPGTVTVCTLAGVNYNFSLLWALLLSVFACIVLQEMAARVGIVTQQNLSSVIIEAVRYPFMRMFSMVLIFSAIVIGNAAYEAGNISGAVLGLTAVLPSPVMAVGSFEINLWSILIGLLAFLLLGIGSYRTLEKVFIALVAVMSISFIVTALVTKPDLEMLLKGLFIPQASDAGWLSVVALIGTTVVPYNLFLHASLVREKWKSSEFMGVARKELVWMILLGGLVSMAIIVTAAASGVTAVNTAGDLAAGLEPLYGEFARWFMAAGLLAAGISSSITAPLAAAYVVSGCLGWKKGLNSKKFKAVWAFILLLGVIFSSLGLKPVEIIHFAQIANGLLLPVVAVFLFWVVNRRSVMGEYKNTSLQNFIGLVIIAVTVLLGLKSILSVLGG